ncbi:hypothetical protein AYO49_04880 [Verrucomicrobiaceae bacterium SCGC AG-212-N21]|nr:hypothetical protein AYO49_04880 [Verrucomicrobiaceae bacterium SCGC AG-212-N21]
MSKKKAAKKSTARRSAAKASKKAPSKSKAKSKPKPKPNARPAAKKASRSAQSPAKTTSGMGTIGEVNWNELMTVAGDSPVAFYTQLFGWTSRPFGQGMDYTVLEQNGKPVAGVVVPPEGGPSPMWIPYVTVQDIDTTARNVELLGGRVCKPPFPIPDVGRIAIVQDPHGAMFGLHSA